MANEKTGGPKSVDEAGVAAALAALGYIEAEQCGLCEAPLREAVRWFQEDEGLVVTGSLDRATLEAIADADTRRKRMGDFPVPPGDERPV